MQTNIADGWTRLLVVRAIRAGGAANVKHVDTATLRAVANITPGTECTRAQAIALIKKGT